MARANVVGVDSIGEYADRIDVRSPAEFREDHIPGAGNYPVLDDAQRERIGTLHKQVSAFAAKKVGAALVARNIAHWLESAFVDKDRDWRPLVYCWRGGKRSGAMVHVLREIGWHAAQLDGGYRAYRRRVVTDLETLPARFRFVVVCGLTGTGKSRLLAALDALRAGGAQVLDLEAIARHRGSLLGDLPARPQPSQKWFESRLRERLQALDHRFPVYVEAESRKIGNVQVPEALIARMRQSECVRVDLHIALRVALLKEEYGHFLTSPDLLRARLRHLVELHGHARIAEWERLIDSGDWDTLVASLLEQHYDPTYERSMRRNYQGYGQALAAAPDDISQGAFAEVAKRLHAIAGARGLGPQELSTTE